MTSNKMDEELRNAALRGDVEYLKKCVESNKPIHYYLSFFPEEEDRSGKFRYGNIFHMEAMENQEEFIREAMMILPQEAKQQLLVQPGDEVNKWNPLHEAAKVGNVEIVKMFLDVYRCLPTLPPDHSERPWLQKTQQGNNPCFVAVVAYQEECALEIYKMDTQLISKMPSRRGSSLLCEAIVMPLAEDDVIGNTPFHDIYFIEGSEGSKEIFRQLLLREPELIKQKNTIGSSSFQAWALNGKIWPFKILLECNDIMQDVNKVYTDLVSSTNMYGRNSLHYLAHYAPCEEDTKKIAELLVEIYKKESPSISNNQHHPWLVKDDFGDSPLSLAIEKKKENLALYLLSVDDNVVIESKKNVLFLAIENECCIAAEEILKIIDNKGWTQLLTNEQKLNVLHLAPLCTKNFCAQLIEGHPELIKGVDKEGSTILHSWIKSDKEWLFNFILESKWKVPFVKLIDAKDYNYQNNPFHVAATTTTHDEATNQIVRLLVQAYKKHIVNWVISDIDQLPWFEKNKENEGPLHLALRNKQDDLALYILSLLRDNQTIKELLDYYEPKHSTLFLAVENNCPKVAKAILEKLDKDSREIYLKNNSDGRNILHLATSLQDKEFGKWLVYEAPEFITDKDKNKESPWDKAYEIGSSWFIEAALKKDPSVFNRAPLAWTKACKNDHVSTLCAFIDHNPGAFRDLCIEHKDSPLHHIQLSSLSKYEDFLQISRMKDLINLQDMQGATPLHISIQKRNKYLTETLLSMDKIAYSIKNKEQKTAIDLLAEACEEDNTWEEICQRIGFDPWIKTSYFQRETNLFEVRNSLFVVAALLATITFTAGFTLPGGLNQETGEALLAKKVAFLVFLMTNTLAMCTSMLVLICLVWSMVVQDSSNTSLMLIDRSMWLLMVAFYSTLLAFMTGVFTVISPKVLWAAIIIIIMCTLIGISANRTLLYKVLFISSSKKKQNRKDPMHLLELGNAFPCCQGSSSQKDE